MMSIRAKYLEFTQGFISIYKTLRGIIPYWFGLSEDHKGVTEEYPDRVSARMPEDLPVRYRGFLQNEIERCTGCGDCEKSCPIQCIRVETEPGLDVGSHWVAVFDIDMARCMFCGLCVEVCPTSSLSHTRKYEGAVFHIDELIYSYGRGWATKGMKDLWRQEQQTKEALVEEKAVRLQSPVGSELRRLSKGNKSE